MTHFQRLSHRRRASRHDLLLVQQETPVVPSDPETALVCMGFRVDRRPSDHWIVTGTRRLPQLHFYSKAELARFLMDRAERYLHPCHRSVPHADTAHLSD